jgi:uncharacterized protein
MKGSESARGKLNANTGAGRYRKEATGGMDEVELHKLQDALERFARIESRRETVLASLSSGGHLTQELRDLVCAAATLNQLEDLYLP